MSLTWYYNRLRAMSPTEVAWRVVERIRRETSRNRHEGWDRFDPGPGPAPALPGFRAQLLKASPEMRAAIAAAAEGVRRGAFSALGMDWPQRDFSRPLTDDDWRLDPVTKGLWPGADTYCFDIDYRHQKTLGDIKYNWEYNRLQFLQPLAAQYALTGCEASLAIIQQALASWFDATPPFRSASWSEILNVAIRGISLLFVSTLCGDDLSPDMARRLRTMLNAHLFWLERFPSRFSSANNHLIAELAAVYLIASAMPEVRASARIAARAELELAHEAQLQFYPDGGNAEQSPNYGAFSAEFLLICARAASLSGRAFPSVINARLADFAAHIAFITNGSGAAPNICDNDQGRVLTLCGDEGRYPASVASAILAHARLPVSPNLAVPPELRTAFFDPPEMTASAPDGMKVFADCGYSVVREKISGRDCIVVFDHGPLGYLSIAAHGHADALAVLLDIDGKPVLTDPGTYLYHSGGAWRDWFRGTRAHNTLSIDGANQSTISGPFAWMQKAACQLHAVADPPGWSVRASHDGYVGPFQAEHHRTVTSTPGGLTIHDRLEGPGAVREVEASFQLSPQCDVRLEGALALVSREGRPILEMQFLQDGALSAQRGGEIGEGGWVSERFGSKVPAWRLSWRGVLPPEGGSVRIHVLPDL